MLSSLLYLSPAWGKRNEFSVYRLTDVVFHPQGRDWGPLQKELEKEKMESHKVTEMSESGRGTQGPNPSNCWV